VKGVVLALGALLVGAVAGSRTAAARESIPAPAPTVADEVRDLSRKLEEARNQLALARVQAQRTAAIIRYSADFRIPADLASAIYDIALSEGIDPEVGFRLVKVESNFDSKALSTKGAIGYTQVQLATAKSYEPSLSSDQLYQRDVNLRLGFRFLRDLLGKYRSDLQLALIAYNRGPSRVQEILDNGGNPDNGYAAAVLRGTSHAHE
jgi:soluble lytic murein transglycosylase-like protein